MFSGRERDRLLTVPPIVARMVVYHCYHPVTAWRYYYGASIEDLASLLNMPVAAIRQLESSNEHLKKDMLQKLSNIFGVMPQAIAIRYQHHHALRFKEDLWVKN